MRRRAAKRRPSRITRREFLSASLAGVVSVSVNAEAQARVARIGVLGATRREDLPALEGLHHGLRERGYVEGQNLAIEYRWAEGRFERLPELAVELAARQPDLIVALVTQASLAAKKATTTTPIVMVGVADPVAAGLVASLARPGGNVTGNSSVSVEVAGKSLELLKEVVPGRRRVAILWNPANAIFQTQMLKEAEGASRRLGFQPQVVAASDTSEIDKAFLVMTRGRAEALAVLPDPVFIRERSRLFALAAKGRLPSVSGVREHAEAGALLAYGPNFYEVYRGAAGYVDRILKGARPGDLPIEQPSKFELVVNLKTATALGLTIPRSLLLRADQVLE